MDICLNEVHAGSVLTVFSALLAMNLDQQSSSKTVFGLRETSEEKSKSSVVVRSTTVGTGLIQTGSVPPSSGVATLEPTVGSIARQARPMSVPPMLDVSLMTWTQTTQLSCVLERHSSSDAANANLVLLRVRAKLALIAAPTVTNL
jgi:hypothetical protein